MSIQLQSHLFRLFAATVLLFGVQGALFAQPDISISAVPLATTQTTGSYIYTEVTIQNIGSVAATNVVLTNAIPAALAPGGPMNHIGGQAATSSTYIVGGGGQLSYASIAPGVTSVYRFVSRIQCSVADLTVFANNFGVTADVDSDNSNDNVSINITASNPAPVFATFPGDINTTTGTGALTCDAVVADLGAYSVSDNCTGTNVALSGVPAGNVFPIGTTVVTYTATDAGGRQTVQTQNVSVTDDTPPLPDVAALSTLVIRYNTPITTFPTATDNCAGTLMGTTTDPLTYAVPGTYSITWTYDDGNGNTTTQVQSVDVVAPDITLSAVALATTQTTGGYIYTEVTIENIGTETATNVVLTNAIGTALAPGGPMNHIGGQAATSSTYIVGGGGQLSYASIAPGVTSRYRFVSRIQCSVADLTVFANNFGVTADLDIDNSNNNTSINITAGNPAPVFATFPADINTTTGVGALTCDALVADPGAYSVTDNCAGTNVVLSGVPAGNVFPIGITVITYTATDAGGRQTVQTQSVSVADDTPPLPDNPVLPTITVRYDTPITTYPLATDNCVGAVSGTTLDPLTYAVPGSYTITWTYDDGNGNTTTQIQAVDVVAPDIAISAVATATTQTTGGYIYTEVTIENIGTETATNVVLANLIPPALAPGGPMNHIGGQAATSSTYIAGGGGQLTYASIAPGVTSKYRFVSRIQCSVADLTVFANNFNAVADVDYDNGNNTASINITAENPAPVFATFPADINTTTGAGALTCDALVADLGAYSVTDNCAGTNVALSGVPAGSVFPFGTTVVSYTASDAGGRQTVQTQNVTVTDDTPPVPDVAALPTLIVRYNTPITTFPAATDNCAGALTGTTTDPLTYAVPGTYSITWTYDDGNGNTTTQIQAVDVVAPDMSISAVATATTQTTGGYIYTEVTIENIGTETATNVVVTNAIGAELAPGGPMNHIGGQAATSTTYIAGGGGQITYASIAPGVTSTYRFVSRIQCSVADETVFANPFAVTADVDYDNSNNNTSINITAENPAPVFATFPADINTTTGTGALTCDALVADLGAYSVSDNCTGTNVALSGVPAGNVFPIGATVVTYTATDAGGRQTVQTQNVTVTDNAPPVPDLATLPTYTAECSYTVTTTPTATDNCAGTLTATTTDPLAYTTQGTHTIVWTYNDGNGNTTTQNQTVIIDDITAPVPDIASLPDLTAECGYTVSVYPTATDNCEGTIVSTTTDPLIYNAQGTFIITWTYDEGNGNTSSQNQTVIIDDITAPVPNIASLPIITGECSATVVTPPTATDNCIGQVTATTTDPLVYTMQGTYTVTWSYNDGNGNISMQNQTVIVDDVTGPVPNLATLPTITGECFAGITSVPTATDACVGAVIGTTTDPLVYATQGTFYVTWTYDDGNGNITTQVQTVIVDDITAPIVSCASGIAVEGDANGQAQVPDFTTGSAATDNCSASGALVWSQSPASGTFAGVGNNTVTVYATDEAGNTGSCTTTFEVVPRAFIETNPDAVAIAFGCNSPLAFTRSVTILNGGGHFNNGQMAWTASTSSSSITITTGSGSEGDAMLFTVNPAGLAPGTYTYYITLTALNSATRTAATNSPYQFPVTVTVEPAYGGSISQTQSVGTSWTPFTNSYGHLIAEVKSNSGPISSFTVTAYPCSYPRAYPRVNFVNRYFNFSAAGSVNVDIRTYFTDTEKKPRVVQPENLVLYQQPVPGGAWFNRGGTSNVPANYVELTGITSLSGNWLPAHPWAAWFPKSLALNVTGTAFDLDTRTISIDWRSLIETDAEGFTIERCFGADPESGTWYEAGIIGFNGHGDYTFAEPVADLGLYHYRISTWDSEGNYFSSPVITIEAADLPGDYTLAQNYPNPFNPETVISYTIPAQETVSLKVYDMFWKEVQSLVDGVQNAGTHEVRFSGARLPSGTYFYQLKAGSTTLTRKMNLTK